MPWVASGARAEDHSRVAEDLRGIVEGEVHCDPAVRAIYASDASLFHVLPLAVVRPRHVDDISAVVGWAAREGVPVHARGAGSGLAGDAVGNGVVLDLSRFFRRILETGDGSVRVQPGVTLRQLDDHLAASGRMLGIDPATAAVTTIGGMLGRNTSGSRFLRHGSMRNHVLAADWVAADGTQRTWGRGQSSAATDPASSRLVAGLSEIRQRHASTLAARIASGRLLHGGYGLPAEEEPIDLAAMLCGSSGTLGLVAEVTLTTVPVDQETAVGLLFFDGLDAAAEAALKIRSLGPSGCDLFDKRHLTLARSANPVLDLLIPAVAEAGLLVEFSASERWLLEDAIRRSRHHQIDVRRADDAADAATFWQLSRTVVSTLHGVRGKVRPVSCMEDIVIPPPALPEVITRFQSILRRQEETALLFAHAGHGQLHLRPFADPRRPGERQRLEALAAEIYEAIAACGGTLGGEQGLGLSRTRFFADRFPDEAAMFVDIKRLYDPAGVLNPGKIVPAESLLPDPTMLEIALSGGSDEGVTAGVGFGGSFRGEAADAEEAPAGSRPLALPVLHWPAGGLEAEVDACNGCGGCRAEGGPLRMCPRFREHPAEEASPRAKAGLIGSLLAGGLDPADLGGDRLRAIADTCFNCHQCRVDCDAGVDIPALVLELKAAAVAAGGMDWSTWLLSRVDVLSAIGGRMGPLANRMLANPQARWLLERVLGLARGRRLPRCTGNEFLRWAARRGLTQPSRRAGTRVLYFLDTYARRHDPELGRAFVAVMEHNGIGVFVDPRQHGSGMPLIAAGDVEAARRLAGKNLRLLADAVRLGYRIVTTEPAAMTALRHDYPLLLEDEEMDRVVAATCDATTFLWELHREGRLRLDFQPLQRRLLYHEPCHLRSHEGGGRTLHLLRLVPGLNCVSGPASCSGMAGTFGLARDRYRSSLRMGRGVVAAVRESGVDAAATECSACRIQLVQGSPKPVIHPIKLLAAAYGLQRGDAAAGTADLFAATPAGLVFD